MRLVYSGRIVISQNNYGNLDAGVKIDVCGRFRPTGGTTSEVVLRPASDVRSREKVIGDSFATPFFFPRECSEVEFWVFI